ncbi:MAG: protein kinase [Alphaproteobacteria bacterium]|nr:protein kinase [Alphaproteobacteria bacterium]
MPITDHIEFLETLGEGSFGVVCLARLTEGPLKRTVVLKILKEDWAEDDRVLTRARDEARLLALLNHDNIVKVERLETVGKKTVVVMEHVQGLSLDLILANLGPLPVRAALQLIGKVATALDAAYNRTPPGELEPLRVVHRDIKPSNIIVSITGAVKVLDFGTARGSWESREARTETAVGMGTLLYMAPECFDEGHPGPEVDVYALGATLYELLSGVHLGRLSVDPARHDAQRAERIAQLNPAELMGYPKVTEIVRDLVDHCIRYNRSERPTAAKLRGLCRQALYALPIQRPNLDLYAETCVEPLWLRRPRQPPPSLAGTLDISGEHQTPAPATRPFAATMMVGRGAAAEARNLAHATARPSLAEPGRGIAPVGSPPPLTQGLPAPRPPPRRSARGDDGPSVRGVALIAFLGVLMGVGVILGLGTMLKGEGPTAEPAEEDAPRRTTRRRATPPSPPEEPTSAPDVAAPTPTPEAQETPPEPERDAPRGTPTPKVEQPPPPSSAPTTARPEPSPKPKPADTKAAPVLVDVLYFPVQDIVLDGVTRQPGRDIPLTLGVHSFSVSSAGQTYSCRFTVDESSSMMRARVDDGTLHCAME